MFVSYINSEYDYTLNTTFKNLIKDLRTKSVITFKKINNIYQIETNDIIVYMNYDDMISTITIKKNNMNLVWVGKRPSVYTMILFYFYFLR